MPSNIFIANNDILKYYIYCLNGNNNNSKYNNSNPISNPNNPNVVITSYSGPTRTSTFR